MTEDDEIPTSEPAPSPIPPPVPPTPVKAAPAPKPPPAATSCCNGGCGCKSGPSGTGKRGCALTGCGVLGILPLVLGGFFILILIIGMIGMASGGQNKQVIEEIVEQGDSTKKIVILDVHGVIFGGTQQGFGPPPLATHLLQQLETIEDDPDVIGVILDMNTPGGEVTATDEVHHRIQQLRESNDLKFVTCMRTVAASGGYYLAAGTDHIVANRLTMTGSIGVIMQGYNLKGLFDKLGVKSETYARGERKDLLNAGRDRKEWEIELLNEMVEEMYTEFAQIVADGRGLDVATVKGFEASIFSGRKALANGLVDELGYMDEAIAAARKLSGDSNATLVRYKAFPSFGSLLLGATSPSTKLDALAEELTPQMKAGVPYYMSPLAQ